MEVVIIWFFLALLVGWLGYKTGLGFRKAFTLSLIISPIWSTVLALCYRSMIKDKEKKLAAELQREADATAEKMKNSDLKRKGAKELAGLQLRKGELIK